MFTFDEMPIPSLGFTGLDGAMSEEEKAIQESAHRFAAEVMRPLAEKVDKLSAEEAVAADSPLFSYYQQMKESGLLDIETMGTLKNEEKARLLPIIFEELAWGDCGLMLGSMVTSFPSYAARLSGDESLIEQFDGRLGCWMATQPDRGSRRDPPMALASLQARGILTEIPSELLRFNSSETKSLLGFIEH